MTVQLANARMTLPIDPVEDQMQGILEMINARLNAPNQLKVGKIRSILLLMFLY